MRKVQAEDQSIIACPPERIWRAIIDFNSYTKWWPASVRIVVHRVTPELVGSRVEIKPYGGRAFLCEVKSIRDGSEMRLRYTGVYRGIGVWTIAESGSSSRVIYRIDLEVADPFMKLLSYVVSIPRLHCKLMREEFSGLEGYLV
jgi:ribosome-associated toxin RatA of RatAB toxin-antitoxin module